MTRVINFIMDGKGRGRPPKQPFYSPSHHSPPRTHLGGGVAVGSAVKRGREDEDDIPMVVQDQTPSFNVSKYKLQAWRGGIPSFDEDDGLKEALLAEYSDGAEWAISTNPHYKRVYDHAIKFHQNAKCAKTKNCTMCTSAPAFSFVGDALKKNLPISLYVEAMKTYPVVNEDFEEAWYLTDLTESGCGEEMVTSETISDLFLEGKLSIRYCQQCYPDIPSAIEDFEKLLRTPFKTKDTTLLQEYQRKKAEARESFIVLLRQVAIMSHFDWLLHQHSNKHTGKQGNPLLNLPAEVDFLQNTTQEIKKQIVALEIGLKTHIDSSVQLAVQGIKFPPHKHLLAAETQEFVKNLLEDADFGALCDNLEAIFHSPAKGVAFKGFWQTMKSVVEEAQPKGAVHPPGYSGDERLRNPFHLAGPNEEFKRFLKDEIRDIVIQHLTHNTDPTVKGTNTKVLFIDTVAHRLEKFFKLNDDEKMATDFHKLQDDNGRTTLSIHNMVSHLNEEFDRKFAALEKKMQDTTDATLTRIDNMHLALTTQIKQLFDVVEALSKSLKD